jgi:anti-sigma B factor antagonist
MKTTIQEQENKIVATLVGELDTTAAIEVEEALKPLFDNQGRDIIIDCTELEYIASSGLRILLSILKQAKAHGSRVILKNVNEDIREVFKLTGFISIFDFE